MGVRGRSDAGRGGFVGGSIPLRGAFLGDPWPAVLLLARGFSLFSDRYWAWIVADGTPRVVGLSWGHAGGASSAAPHRNARLGEESGPWQVQMIGAACLGRREPLDVSVVEVP